MSTTVEIRERHEHDSTKYIDSSFHRKTHKDRGELLDRLEAAEKKLIQAHMEVDLAAYSMDAATLEAWKERIKEQS